MIATRRSRIAAISSGWCECSVREQLARLEPPGPTGSASQPDGAVNGCGTGRAQILDAVPARPAPARRPAPRARRPGSRNRQVQFDSPVTYDASGLHHQGTAGVSLSEESPMICVSRKVQLRDRPGNQRRPQLTAIHAGRRRTSTAAESVTISIFSGSRRAGGVLDR